MENVTYSDELYHYGRKGMKWYQNIYTAHKKNVTARKRKKNLAKAREAKAEKQRIAAERAKQIESGRISPKKMTSAELKARLERLNLEKDYQKALNETRGSAKLKRFVGEILEASGKNIATQTLTYVTGRGVNELLKGVFDDPAVINPKKGQKDK